MEILRYPSARPLLAGEYQHMEYFRVVCVGEFSLFFEVTEWENIIVQGTLDEPALHHAALAIGALASSRYHPSLWQSTPAVVFSIRHYSMAIQDLRGRLDGSPRSVELAVLASVLFSYIEFLLDIDTRVEMHIQAGCSMLENLLTRDDITLALPSRAGSNYEIIYWFKSSCTQAASYQAIKCTPRYTSIECGDNLTGQQSLASLGLALYHWARAVLKEYLLFFDSIRKSAIPPLIGKKCHNPVFFHATPALPTMS
ncbi:hypothetical protein BKA59DRAFT_461024 [Fusarium tricinctum]|uniref:Transcription factor domain-containing protein n=1 Tax=Fusarium tricinctum TaxID=61284 RepID=A0A8K0RJA0_9HYPO|nr:hypothetical protein BKA59DRAFT_461024 [Fusarium tricinctum]